MLMIRPIKITPLMVTASNAGSADAQWMASASYKLGDRVFLAETGKSYECVQEPALDKHPATEGLYWMIAGPSNRWAMFDSEISTGTTTAGDLTTTITVAGRINALALFGLAGSKVTVVQRSAANAVLCQFSKTLRTQPSDWYEYFFVEPEQIAEAIFTGLVPSSGSRVEITISGPARCAAVVVGNTFDLGDAQWGATTSIIDYSRKNTTAEGTQSFEPGRFSRRMSVRLEQPRERYPAVQRTLEAVRATPCVWLGVPGRQAYSPMTIYGYYKDFSLEVAYPTKHLCSLEIESLT